MSERRPSTKSAAHRFGFVSCPSCNPTGLPSGDIPKEKLCAWCWSGEDETHRRFVPLARDKEYRLAHGLPEDEDDIPTSPESRSALQNPPPLERLDEVPDTDPAPRFKPPIRREDDD
jgi:hypothetical protein